MHVHATQVNPYAALDALRSAQKVQANREAELVRKELIDSASELAGEPELSDACVVKLEARQESQRQSKRRNQKQPRNQASDAESSASEEEEGHLSDWA